MGRWKRLTTTAAVATAVLVPAGTAHAGGYSVWACDGPDGQAISMGSWEAYAAPSDSIAHSDRCQGTDDAASFSWSKDQTVKVGQQGGYELPAPPGALVQAVQWTGSVSGIDGTGMRVEIDSSAGGVMWTDKDLPTAKRDFPLPGDGAQLVALRLHCHRNAGCTSADARGTVVGLRADLRDSSWPQVANVTGSLGDSGPKSGVETLQFDATDEGSGLWRAYLEVDGNRAPSGPRTVAISDNDGKCVPFPGTAHDFAVVQPCATSASDIELKWDTTAESEGDHTVRAVIADASGNETTVFGPVTEHVDNVADPAAATPPSVSGKPWVGRTLTADPGDWNVDAVDTRWQRCDESGCVDVPDGEGGSGSSYVVRESDRGKQLRIRVTGTNAKRETTTATSDRTDPATYPPPVDEEPPAIGGNAIEGSTLQALPGTWRGASGYGYRWERCDASGAGCQDIPAATTQTYTTGPDDVGHALVVEVTATNADGMGTTRATDPTSPVAARQTASAAQTRPEEASDAGSQRTGGGHPATLTPSGAGTPAPRVNSTDGRVGTSLTAREVGSRSEHRVVHAKYRHPPVLTGVLRDAHGRPVAGAHIEVLEKVRRHGAHERRVATVVTGPDGEFRYRVKKGPSRRIRFAYRRHMGDSSFAFARTVVLRVRASLRFHVTPGHTRNGHKIRFHGRIRGSHVRKVVELQVRKDGRWETFQTVRSHHGRFESHYRFRRTFVKTAYRFRALARHERGFPFRSGHSPARRVIVRP